MGHFNQPYGADGNIYFYIYIILVTFLSNVHVFKELWKIAKGEIKIQNKNTTVGTVPKSIWKS